MRRLTCICLCFAIVLLSFFLAGCASDIDPDDAYRFGYEDGYRDGYKDGLNGNDASAPAASCDYVLNKNSKKFHYPSCASVDDMAEYNKVFFSGKRDEVIAMGYTPCKRCYP